MAGVGAQIGWLTVKLGPFAQVIFRFGSVLSHFGLCRCKIRAFGLVFYLLFGLVWFGLSVLVRVGVVRALVGGSGSCGCLLVRIHLCYVSCLK